LKRIKIPSLDPTGKLIWRKSLIYIDTTGGTSTENTQKRYALTSVSLFLFTV